ncbi:FBP domain-containing protein [Streptomyces aureoverticillatus]|uniref:FBP domain-containing protein n=1 Tax=Streptomyces aureoverticillatus TaxID=66871 RepID=UPI0013DAEFEA|nr:FBP domain-containing protein [Streptomyces aureoverticillatus]QIB42545.1 FBP domain-containing protein [Streptomyces aureoverticillatus]
MRALGEKEIRASFVNCSKGEARRLSLPADFTGTPWSDLDFLGWRDPKAPDRGYAVTERDGELVGIALRASTGARRSALKSSICSVCVTPQAGSGITLLVAPRAGEAGRQGNTVGLYICADLACSLYVRGKKQSALARRFEESLTLEEQNERTTRNLNGFLDQVLGQA